MKTAFYVLMIFFVSVLHAIAKEKHEVLCEKIILSHKLKPSLTSAEKRLICGDHEENSEIPNEAWKTIPRAQAKFHLGTFLQERGYLHPKFQEDPKENSIYVEVGETTRVTKIVAFGDPKELHIEKKRKII